MSVNDDDVQGLSAPDSKAGKLQRQCLERLRAHEQQPDGLPTSVRFIFYEFVKDGVIAKHNNNSGGRRIDQNVAEAIFRLREIRLVPWWWIADEIHRASRVRLCGKSAPTATRTSYRPTQSPAQKAAAPDGDENPQHGREDEHGG
jgi:hypothetical protein